MKLQTPRATFAFIDNYSTDPRASVLKQLWRLQRSLIDFFLLYLGFWRATDYKRFFILAHKQKLNSNPSDYTQRAKEENDKLFVWDPHKNGDWWQTIN